MEKDSFIMKAFCDTHETIARIDTSAATIEFFSHDDKSIELNKNMDLKEYTLEYIRRKNVHNDDIPEFDVLTDITKLRERCRSNENGTLLVYRRISGDRILWSRLIISVPDDYSDEQPCILLYRRDMSPMEADGQDAVRVINERVRKILKCDLKNKSFRTIKLIKSEEHLISRYRKSRYQPGEKLVEEEFVHPDDREYFRRKTDYYNVIAFFSAGAEEKTMFYRRRTGSTYHWVKLRIYPASEYTHDTPVFIYVIEDVHSTMNGFFAAQAGKRIISGFDDKLDMAESYYENMMNVLSYFTQDYIDLYLVDLSTDKVMRYKNDRRTLGGNVPFVISYSKWADKFISRRLHREDRRHMRCYDTSEKLRDALTDRSSVEYTFVNEDGITVRTICSKVDSCDGVPTKVLCRSIVAAAGGQMKVKTFGNFEVYDKEGMPIRFTRKKSRQLLAYLVDKRGYPVSTADLIADVLEKPVNDLNSAKYISSLMRSAASDLLKAGYKDIIIKEWNSMRVNVDMLDCDYYHLIDGDPRFADMYGGEYMKEYSWAEETNAELYADLIGT